MPPPQQQGYRLLRAVKQPKWTLEVPEVQLQDVGDQIAALRKCLGDKASKEDKARGLEIAQLLLQKYPLDGPSLVQVDQAVMGAFMPPATADMALVLEAANILGLISARQQSNMRVDLVIAKLERGMGWLLSSQESSHRHAALALLSTLSREVPDVFEEVVLHQEGGSYLSHVIQLLRTSAAAIKEHASEALGRSLAIFNQYELVDSTRLDDLYDLLSQLEGNHSESTHLGAALALEQVLRHYSRYSVVRSRLSAPLHAFVKLFDSRHSSLQRQALVLAPLAIDKLRMLRDTLPTADKTYLAEAWRDVSTLIETAETRTVQAATRMAGRERDKDRLFLFTVWGPLMEVMGNKMYAHDANRCKMVWDLLQETLASGQAGDLLTKAALECVTKMVKLLGTFLTGSFPEMIEACCNAALGQGALTILEEFGRYEHVELTIEESLLRNIGRALERPVVEPVDADARLRALQLLCDMDLRAVRVPLANVSGPVSVLLGDGSVEVRKRASQALIRIIVAAVIQQQRGGSMASIAPGSIPPAPSLLRQSSLSEPPKSSQGGRRDSQSTLPSGVGAGGGAAGAGASVSTAVPTATMAPPVAAGAGSSVSLLSFSSRNRLNDVAREVRAILPKRSRDLLLRILRLAVTDPAPEVRDAVLREAMEYRELDQVLCEDDFLDVLFTAGKDVVRSVRKLSFVTLGLLMPHNYKIIMPYINSAVLNVLEMLEVSPSQASIMLLSNIVHASPSIARMHAAAILAVTVPLLERAEIVDDVLVLMGELAQAGCVELGQHLPVLIEKGMAHLQDFANVRSRKVSVDLFIQLQQMDGTLASPLNLAESLIPLLTKNLSREYDSRLRLRYLTLLGTFGILPSVSLSPKGQHAESAHDPNILDEFAMHELKGKNEYNALAAVNALIRVASEPRNFVHYEDVQRALVVLIKFSSAQCETAVPRIIRCFVHMIRQTTLQEGDLDVPVKEFRSFLALVTPGDKLVQAEMRRVMDLLAELWHEVKYRALLLFLVEQMCQAFQIHVIPFVNTILTLLAEVLEKTYATDGGLALPLRALKILRVMAPYLQDWVPVLAKLLSHPLDERNHVKLRKESVGTVGHVCLNVNMAPSVTPLILAVASCLKEEQLRVSSAEILAILAYQLGPEYVTVGHASRINNLLYHYNVTSTAYEKIVSCMYDENLLKQAYEASNFSSLQMDDMPAPETTQPPNLTVSQDNIRASWDFNITGGEKAYHDWFRRLSRVHLRESPSPPLRACYLVAERYQPLARELLNAAFVSCWCELYDEVQEHVVTQMERIFTDPSPHCREIKLALLDLKHFMEFMKRGTLFVQEELMAGAANSVRSFAEALVISERTFLKLTEGDGMGVDSLPNTLSPSSSSTIPSDGVSRSGTVAGGAASAVHSMPTGTSASTLAPSLASSTTIAPTYPPLPSSASTSMGMTLSPEGIPLGDADQQRQSLQTCIQLLIELNNSLDQPDAARGIMAHAQKAHYMASAAVPAKWHELLRNWDDALRSYRRDSTDPTRVGELRCLVKLGRYKQAAELVDHVLPAVQNEKMLSELSRLGCIANICLKDWTRLKKFVLASTEDVDLLMAEAIVAVSERRFDDAEKIIDRARTHLDSPISLTLAENVDRGAELLFQAQLLTELQEVVRYMTQYDEVQREMVVKSWQARMTCSTDVQCCETILALRSLVLTAEQQRSSFVQLGEMMVTGLQGFGLAPDVERSFRTLSTLLHGEPGAGGGGSGGPQQPFGSARYPIHSPMYFVSTGRLPQGEPTAVYAYIKNVWRLGKDTHAQAIRMLEVLEGSLRLGRHEQGKSELLSSIYCQLGCWYQEDADGALTEDLANKISKCQRNAIEENPRHALAWHHLALANFAFLTQIEAEAEPDLRRIETYAAEAVTALFKVISLDSATRTQDALSLIRLWFTFGHLPKVKHEIDECRGSVPSDTWLDLIPQFVANIDCKEPVVRASISNILQDIGQKHPHALLTPLFVACKSSEPSRAAEAQKILERLRPSCKVLIDETEVMCAELIRVSALWHEEWHAALQDASCFYFDESNVAATKKVLLPLHEKLQRPETLSEYSFQASYQMQLDEAQAWLEQHDRTNSRDDLNSAWAVYYGVFRRIARALPLYTKLNLEHASPKLLAMRDLTVVVPGTYKPGGKHVTVTSFVPELSVINSKQRPRRMSLRGSDGRVYSFLLKGNEDPRTDERAMAFFGLVNQLLASKPATAQQRLSIICYSITPLSPRCGLIGWVPDCDTLHSLIRQYRSDRKVSLYLEDTIKKRLAPEVKDSSGRPSDRGYDSLPLICKVEIFQQAMAESKGDDLANILRAKSPDTEIWFNSRTAFTRSLAVMSMVGYLLGLGDRHPSNLMLQRGSGKIVHIDFGDCFEVAQRREKYPEKVPFRLTRMLIKAMEVSGIEGTYRQTCQRVLELLRDNKESLMTVLDALARDPLLVWGPGGHGAAGVAHASMGDIATDDSDVAERVVVDEDGVGVAAGVVEDGGAAVELKTRTGRKRKEDALSASDMAKKIIRRVEHKLNGTDFDENQTLTVQKQVDCLIAEATSHFNLAQAYSGWCPFW